MGDDKPETPLTPEAEKAGWDPNLVSDPSLEEVKEGIVDADSE